MELKEAKRLASYAASPAFQGCHPPGGESPFQTTGPTTKVFLHSERFIREIVKILPQRTRLVFLNPEESKLHLSFCLVPMSDPFLYPGIISSFIWSPPSNLMTFPYTS